MKTIKTKWKLTLITGAGLLTIFSGCGQPSVSGVSSGGSGSSGGTTSSSSSCTTSVIDYGSKFNITTATRGLYSDVKLLPGTAYPAVVYQDSAASALKYAYWNGIRFIPETVAGDLAANITFVQLAFLSTGVPIVAWTTGGTTVKVAIRSAASTSSGTWTAAVVDTFTGGATRAPRLAVSPNDDVALTYVTNTAAGVLKFMYCPATCSNPASFVPMAAANNVEGAAIAAATVHTGLAWCKLTGASTYYPAVAYGGTAAYRYAVCQQASLANCLTAANWTKQNVVATANLVAGDIYLDPTVNGDQPKVVAKNAATTAVTYKMTGGSAQCDGAVGAFGVGATLTTGTMASQFIRLMKSSNDRFHVVANNGTASVVYYNSQTNDVTGLWNGVGTIETATLQAGAGGAVVNNSAGQIYTTYGVSTGSFTLNLGVVNDYTVSSATATNAYYRYVVDSTGYSQLLASPVRNIAVASASGGLPGVAYIDYPGGAAASTNGSSLKYALRSSSSASSSWKSYTIPGTGTPQYPSLAYDSSGYPWVGFHESLAGNIRYYLVTTSNADGSGVWTSYQFPHIPTAAPVALPAANETAVAMYYSGGTTTPVMIIIDNVAGSLRVRAARLNPTTGVWGTVNTLKTLGASGAAHLSAHNDTSGNIVVSFYDITTTRLNYVYSSDGGTTWSTAYELSSAGSGIGGIIRINPSTGKPAVSYYDKTNNRIYYAPCTGTIAACATGGWSPSIVDNAAGVSGLATTVEQLLRVGMDMDSSGNPFIIYPRGASSDASLILQQISSGTFASSTLHAGANGNLMTGAGALNYAVAGWGASSTINSSGARTSVYVGPGNWLYSTSCGD